MRIGFTGTRQGMTKEQQATLRSLLNADTGEFHHGDCIGADAQAHDIAVGMGYNIIIHPPFAVSHRAFKSDGSWKTRAPKDYLERNKDIVMETDYLIATPELEVETTRSGTWSTVRFARKHMRMITIIKPNGNIVTEFH